MVECVMRTLLMHGNTNKAQLDDEGRAFVLHAALLDPKSKGTETILNSYSISKCLEHLLCGCEPIAHHKLIL